LLLLLLLMLSLMMIYRGSNLLLMMTNLRLHCALAWIIPKTEKVLMLFRVSHSRSQLHT
jgi:hypothetical protein